MTKITANTAEDFVDKAHDVFGGSNLGTTDYKTASKSGNFKDGQINGVSFSMSIKLDYAEVGGGKPDDINKTAIKELADIAKKHEKKHEDSYNKAFKAWGADKVAKKIMAETYKDQAAAEKAVADALEDLENELKEACYALHAKEGVVDVEVTKGKPIKIIQKPAGRKGCD